MRLLALALISVFLANSAVAQVYRCKDSAGNTTLSDRPCMANQAGGLVERKRTNEEIYQERMQAAEANERKYQQEMREMEQRQLETQQRAINQQASGTPPSAQQQSNSPACKEARKELEFVSSVRTISQDEKRMRTNAAISNVNAACGSNTQLMQEPPKVIVKPGRSTHITNCNGGFCNDTSGQVYNRTGSLLIDQNGRACQMIGNMVQCP
ncbi:MAG: DUF4124 domain-containing protein [Comamonas sp.]|uniref:DUF4124 domain-containing protein n=1 Tax=Comamonas sp. TaxID=34028 RepID=UPI002FCC82D3